MWKLRNILHANNTLKYSSRKFPQLVIKKNRDKLSNHFHTSVNVSQHQPSELPDNISQRTDQSECRSEVESVIAQSSDYLAKISEYARKHGKVITQPRSSIKKKKISKDMSTIQEEQEKKEVRKDVIEQFFGKNSRYHQNMLKEYYDESSLRHWEDHTRNYNQAKIAWKSEKRLLKQNHLFESKIFNEKLPHFESIVDTLKVITPTDLTTESIGEDPYLLVNSTKISNTKLPPYPESWSLKSFESYIEIICTKKFVQTKSSYGFGGLVTDMLRDLLRKTNIDTVHFHTTKTFNYALRYFRIINDIKSQREFFEQMQTNNIPKDTDTYNIMLMTIQESKDFPSTVDPMVVASSYLFKMKREGIPANVDTWNAVLGGLSYRIAKVALLRTMQDINIPLTPTSIYYVIEELLISIGPKATVEFIRNELKEGYDSRSVTLVVKHLIQKDFINEAWTFIIEQADNQGILPTNSLLNVMASEFAYRQRPDWIIGLMSGLSKYYHIKPTMTTYEKLLKSVVSPGYRKDWRFVVKVVYGKLCQAAPGTKLAKTSLYWVTKSRVLSQNEVERGVEKESIVLNKRLTDHEINFWDQCYKTLQWNKVDKLDLVYPQNTNRSKYKLAKRLGVPLIKLLRYKGLNSSQKRSAATDSQKQMSIMEMRAAILQKTQAKTSKIILSDYTTRLEKLSLGPKLYLAKRLQKEGVTKQ